MSKEATPPLDGGAELATVDAPIAPTSPTTGPPDINRLMEIALSQGPDGVASLEKLVDLQQKLDARAAEKEFNGALLAFQNACPVVKKNAKAKDKDGGLMYEFTRIDYLTRTIGPYAQPQGLSWTWEDDITGPDGHIRVFTIIRHTGGHSVRTLGPAFPIPETNKRTNKTQCVAQAQSYARRYGLFSALGIVTGNDDNDAQGVEEFIDDNQIANIQAKMDELSKLDPAKFLKFMGVDQIAHIVNGDYKKAIRGLEGQQ